MRKEIMVLVLLVLSTNIVNAQVVNGGFETGDFSGWDSVTVCSVTAAAANDSNWGCKINYQGSSSGAWLKQYSVEGAHYTTVSFDAFIMEEGGMFKTEFFGNYNQDYPSHNYWVRYEMPLGTTTDDIIFRSTGGYAYIDNVELTGYSPPSPMTYNFKDECGNLLKSGYCDIDINNTVSHTLYGYSNNPVSFSNNYFNTTDNLILESTTHKSTLQWSKYPSYGGSEDITVDVEWDLEITVRNQTDNTIIPNAKVDMSFGCRCNSASATETRYTNAQGKTTFSDMANQNTDYTLTRPGYTTVSSTIGVDFSPQSENYVATIYMVPVVSGDPDPPDPDPNPQDPEDPTVNETSVYFTDMSDVVMSQFNKDECTQFKLWCRNKDYNDATLTFEYYNSTTEVFEVVSTWTLSANDYSTYIIPETSFPQTGTYKAKLQTDVTDTKMISIIDNTLYFDIKCYTYNNDTGLALNTTIVNIGGVDSSTGADNYLAYYVAEGSYNIYAHKTGYETTTTINVNVSGADLTVLIYLDPVEVFYSFTIDVFDINNQPITYATVYLEGYASKSTGSSNFATYTGLSSGDYRYKASKTGYFSVAWINTSIMASDISETVVLTETTFTSDINIQNDGRTGKVNESTDHKVDVYIDSNNDSKYNTTVVFYKESIEKANITITKINFTGNHFIWYPDILHYVDTRTYYAKLYDENDYLLCEDNVYCDDPSISSYNFTVYTFTEGGSQLQGVTVTLEGIGTCGTGTSHYCTHYGLVPTTYTYYAAKDGYITSTPSQVEIINQDLSTNIYLVLYVAPETYNVQINVYNATGTTLTDARVYLSGKDSIATGSTNYGLFTNISTGTYQYKASKSGFITSTLTNLNVDGHESVNVYLSIGQDVESYTTTRVSDIEIKNVYLPLMWLLFFAVILGALLTLISGRW